jgi:hypothetical protein
MDDAVLSAADTNTTPPPPVAASPSAPVSVPPGSVSEATSTTADNAKATAPLRGGADMEHHQPRAPPHYDNAPSTPQGLGY